MARRKVAHYHRWGPSWICDGWTRWLLLPPKSVCWTNHTKFVKWKYEFHRKKLIRLWNWISSLLTARTLSSQQNVTRGTIFTSVLILNIFQPNLLLAWASAFGCAPSEPWETEMDGLNSWRCIIFPRCTDGVEVNQDNSIMEEKVHLYFEGHYAKSPQVGRFVF